MQQAISEIQEIKRIVTQFSEEIKTESDNMSCSFGSETYLRKSLLEIIEEMNQLGGTKNQMANALADIADMYENTESKILTFSS